MTEANRRHGRTRLDRWPAIHCGPPGGPQVSVDGDGKEAPSPVTMLLCAAGACSGADVVSILEKKRIKLTRFHIDVGGRRAADYPRALPRALAAGSAWRARV